MMTSLLLTSILFSLDVESTVSSCSPTSTCESGEYCGNFNDDGVWQLSSEGICGDVGNDTVCNINEGQYCSSTKFCKAGTCTDLPVAKSACLAHGSCAPDLVCGNFDAEGVWLKSDVPGYCGAAGSDDCSTTNYVFCDSDGYYCDATDKCLASAPPCATGVTCLNDTACGNFDVDGVWTSGDEGVCGKVTTASSCSEVAGIYCQDSKYCASSECVVFPNKCTSAECGCGKFDIDGVWSGWVSGDVDDICGTASVDKHCNETGGIFCGVGKYCADGLCVDISKACDDDDTCDESFDCGVFSADGLWIKSYEGICGILSTDPTTCNMSAGFHCADAFHCDAGVCQPNAIECPETSCSGGSVCGAFDADGVWTAAASGICGSETDVADSCNETAGIYCADGQYCGGGVCKIVSTAVECPGTTCSGGSACGAFDADGIWVAGDTGVCGTVTETTVVCDFATAKYCEDGYSCDNEGACSALPAVGDHCLSNGGCNTDLTCGIFNGEEVFMGLSSSEGRCASPFDNGSCGSARHKLL
eukprot:GHVH01012593.1.p1 GENE.GHVH01012593.1~~GHVH01012593.1.p1  ORF type:complete len:531 (-),score=59.82 GHVH01012593.1:6-1598(-)